MLEGWYCRTMANQHNQQQLPAEHTHNNTNNNMNNVDESDSEESQENENSNIKNKSLDYRNQYRYLKQKLKFLIYENEFFQEALRVNQRRLLKVSRDRAFLLDRLLHYEKPELTSSDDDETESSEDEASKRRKLEQSTQPMSTGSGRGRKRKVPLSITAPPTENIVNEIANQEKVESVDSPDMTIQQGHMTAAEVERHLQSKQPGLELMPERAPATVPNEMFSNEPSLDSESNDHIIDGSSPTHVAAEECVPMEYTSDI